MDETGTAPVGCQPEVTMSAILTATASRAAAPSRTVTPSRTARTAALAGVGLLATAVASGATTAVAAAGSAAGISLDIAGEPIPVSGFAVVTAFFSVIGLAIAVVLSFTARNPRRAWVRTTVALTVLSFVPDLIADAAPGTKALLMLTHLVAAAIVVPTVARRLV
jgi:hypothetical protein